MYIVGSMTVPFALDDIKSLRWLEIWIEGSFAGVDPIECLCELVFSRAKDMQDSFNFILNNDTGWYHVEENKLLTPDGRAVHIFGSIDAEKLLKEIELKND